MPWGIVETQKNAAIAWIRHTASPRHFHPTNRAGIRARDFDAPPSHVHTAHSGVWRAAAASCYRCRASLNVAGAAQELSKTGVHALLSMHVTQAFVFKTYLPEPVSR